MKCPILLTALVLSAVASTAAEFRNPVRAGDFPDPSVIRVGDEYWATATSSEWAPYFPLLRSRDLVNWEPQGTVFSVRPEWAKGNFWAPEIAEYKGRYFIYYTARDRASNRLAVAVATADRPGGPYTDHGPLVMEAEGSIDGMPFTDVDGVRWLLWKNDGNSVRKPTPIWLQRLSEDGLQLVGERQQILTNDVPWEHAVVEGPFVLRHGDYYYLFYSGGACCGRECNYALGVARAKSMRGPWVKAPTNPILATNDQWRCPGHGSIVADRDGRYWLLYHSYASRGFVATGRQMLLDEVKFGADGWPTINDGRGPSTRAAAPRGAGAQRDTVALRDDFTGSELIAGWQWLNGPRPALRFERGRLVLAARDGAAGLAQPIRAASFVAETVVDLDKPSPSVFAGLGVYGDGANGIHLLTDGRNVQVWTYRKNEKAIVADAEITARGQVALRVACEDGSRFRFAARGADGTWREIGAETNGAHLPPWDRAVRIGLSVRGAGKAESVFEYFDLRAGPDPLLTR